MQKSTLYWQGIFLLRAFSPGIKPLLKKCLILSPSFLSAGTCSFCARSHGVLFTRVSVLTWVGWLALPLWLGWTPILPAVLLTSCIRSLRVLSLFHWGVNTCLVLHRAPGLPLASIWMPRTWEAAMSLLGTFWVQPVRPENYLSRRQTWD